MEFIITLLFLLMFFAIALMVLGAFSGAPGLFLVGLLITLLDVVVLENIKKFPKEPSESEVNLKPIYNINTDSIYALGYKRGQIDCQNDSIVWKRVLNDDRELIFQKTK